MSAAAAITALALGGCSDPYSQRPGPPRQPSAATATEGHAGAALSSPRPPTADPPPTTDHLPPTTEHLSPPTHHLSAAKSLGPTPAAAIRAFGRLYTNWTAATVAGHLDRLARASTGEAASEMARAAQESRGDYELHRSGVFNRGTLEAVAVQPGHPGRYVVVTLESTGATSKQYAGLKPAFHVTLARVRRTAAGWTVSAWLPQS